jgi:deazaflavin-dependent oxidoreductase (nitroreductase family)
MGDADAADWTRQHLETYLGSGGAQGHILDLSSAGGHQLGTHCLIRVAGRKSGTPHVTPLIYGIVGGEVVIVASKGGADTDPQWYLNIRESETVDVQIATQAFEATWREPEYEERHQVWAYMTHLFPPYLGYQSSTTRHIPVFTA